MPSAFSHAIAAYAAGKIYPRTKTSFKFFLTGMICAAFPDIDAIGFWMGIPYHSIWGHRGITHSFFFAFALAFVVMQLFYANEKVLSRYATFFRFGPSLFLPSASPGFSAAGDWLFLKASLPGFGFHV
jgi:inner membrane protein